jgi:NAD(P)-dependent dehydrogenase (short-subunit alcohol dehydrogenase family)
MIRIVMGKPLEGEVAIVTGGGSGIGRQSALLLADAGASVVVGDLRREPRDGGLPTDALIESAGGTARFVEFDVTDAAARESLVAAAEEAGGVSVLVNCAGIFRATPFFEIAESDYDQMMDINVKGTLFTCQAAAARMAARGRGSIVNLSSVAGIQGAANFSLYCATKGAVRLLTYALAEELGPHGVRVNALHPGFIETSMTKTDVPIVGTTAADAYLETIPLGRAGSPADVARTVVFLAGPDSAYVTGASLTVDGGRMRTS